MEAKKPEMKLLLLGDQAVGKSSIISRYTENQFQLNIMGTAGIDLKKKIVKIADDEVKVLIYDSAGHERFRKVAVNQFKGSQGVILIYDVTEKKSFERVTAWMESIKEEVDSENVEILLLGNKIDLENERAVTLKEGTEIAKNYNVEFMETSAKTGENVESAFMRIINKIYNKTKSNHVKQGQQLLSKEEPKKKSKCC
jgi:Ras-related protein Rab-1A